MTELVITTPEALHDIVTRALRNIQAEGVVYQPSPWITTEEASEYLKLSADELCRRAAAGRIPASKLGKSWRFHRGQIDGWLYDN